MTKEQILQKKVRLNKYLEHVRQQLGTSMGEIHSFWQREEKKTKASIERLS